MRISRAMSVSLDNKSVDNFQQVMFLFSNCMTINFQIKTIGLSLGVGHTFYNEQTQLKSQNKPLLYILGLAAIKSTG